MLSELAGDMAGRRRMAGEHGERVQPLLLVALLEALAQQDLLARFMDGPTEPEGAEVGFPRSGDGPAGEDLGEGRDIGLGIAAVDAEGVQLQKLAGEIFVEAELAALSHPRIGAGRARV